MLKQVDAVGNLSPSRRIPTRCIVNGGFILAKPNGGGRSQEVTNRSSDACCSLLKDAITFQKRCTVRSILVNPPAYLVFARISSTSIPPSDGPLIRIWSSGSLKSCSHGLSITSQSPLVKACDCSFSLSYSRYFATNPFVFG